MNIVIVNHYAGGPGFGMEFRPYYLASEWEKAGHKVIVVAASFSHLRTKQPEVHTATKQENIDGVEYVWLKVNSYDGNGIGRVLSIFNFTFKLYANLGKTLRNFKPDLIIASSTYPLDILPLKSLSKKFAAKFCYEVHDLWPLSPMELGGYSKYHPFIMVMQYAENFAYKNADLVVSILPKTLDHMVSHGLTPDKFCYIPNGIVLKEWETKNPTHPHDEFFRKLKNDQKTIVGYIGGHAISNALETLIDAAKLAQGTNPNLMFVLVGGGTEKRQLISKAKELELDNISFLDPVPKNSVPALLDEMDILYLGWHNNPLYRFGISPNKLMDYMMAGKPIVHSVNAGNDFVADSGCGISVEPDSPALIVNALAKIAEMSKEDQARIGSKGRDFVLKNHNYKVLAQKFIDFARLKGTLN
jgi:glycosyltransferase involved in cell wall biosynthesis